MGTRNTHRAATINSTAERFSWDKFRGNSAAWSRLFCHWTPATAALATGQGPAHYADELGPIGGAVAESLGIDIEENKESEDKKTAEEITFVQ